MYTAYAKKIYRYFLRRVGYHHELAEDLTQETFLKAFSKFPKFQDRGAAYIGYLSRIAHNMLANYYRAKKPVPLEEAKIEDVKNAPAEIMKKVERKFIARKIWDAIKKLSAKERDVVVMRYRKSMSVGQIARAMHKTENAIRLILSRAQKKLSNYLLFSGSDDLLGAAA